MNANLDAISAIVRATIAETVPPVVQAAMLAATGEATLPRYIRPESQAERNYRMLEKIYLDQYTPLALTKLPCEEHQGQHKCIAVRNARGDTHSYCLARVFLALHRCSARGHYQFPRGLPMSLQALEEALT